MKRKLLNAVLVSTMVLILMAMPLLGAAAENTQIALFNWDGGETIKVMEDMIARFEKANPGITIKNMNFPADYDTKITTMVAAGTPPDIAFLESGTVLYPFSSEGKLSNLEDFMKNDPDYDESSMMEALKYYDGDKLIGYNATGAETIAMFYNTQLFDKYGVEYPPAKFSEAWDWDKFVDVAKTLTIDKNGKNAHDPDFDPENIATYGVSFGKWWAVYMPFIYSMGGNYLNEDGTKIGLNEPAGITALQNLADLIWVHHVSPTATASSILPGLAESFMTNKIAMVFDGQWMNTPLMSEKVPYNVAALPKMGEKAATIAVGSSLSIFDTPNKEISWKVFKALAEPAFALPLCATGNVMPGNAASYTVEGAKEWITENHPSNQYDTFCLSMIDGSARPTVTGTVINFNQINDVLSPALDLLWSGEKFAQEALAPVADQANALVAGYRKK